METKEQKEQSAQKAEKSATGVKNIEKIFDLYFLTRRLKETLRRGWTGWKVKDYRIESIAEHIFGTIMLATSICANTETDVDINKVALMLALHETEEIVIEDLTPFDIEKNKTKRQDGKVAVDYVFKDCENRDYFMDIIEEFEKRETPEAKFAFQCDKMEADLQAYFYEGHFDWKSVPDNMKNDERVLALRNKGFNKVSELFLQNDKHYFSDIFLDLANRLEEKEKNKTKIK